MRADKRSPLKGDKKSPARSHKRGVVGYSKKTALLEEAITQMNAGKYGRSSAALKELLALDPSNMEARRLFATLHLRLGSLIPARQAFDALINEAFERQDYWLAESLLREYLAAGPRCVPFIEKLGSVYQQKGDALEAVTEYGKAIDILIEDPDPDNPHHASQLYAKIRELAPASPVAFRLAPLFDAQTGELTARPSVTEAEPAGPAAATQAESPILDSAVPESPAGAMPREEGTEEAGQTTSMPVAAATVEEILSRQAAFEPQIAAHPMDPLPGAPAEDGTAAESLPISETPSSVSTAAAFLEEPQESVLSEGEPSQPLSDTGPFRTDESLSVLQGEAPAGEQPPNHDAPPEAPLQAGAESHVGNVSGPETISAPMPWEQIQESTIDIPQPVSDEPPHFHFESPAVPPASPQPVQENGQEHPYPTLNVESVASTPETSTPPGEASTSLSLEALKTGKFSWESLFSKAWKSSDPPSADNPQTANADEPASSTVAAPEGSASVSVDSTPVEQARSATVATSPAVPVAQPMPWDQVQDTPIVIPPVSVDETPVDMAVSGRTEMATPVEEVSRLEATILAPPLMLDQSRFSIDEPAPAPTSREPEFRLIGDDRMPCIEPPQPPVAERAASSPLEDRKSEQMLSSMDRAASAIVEPAEAADTAMAQSFAQAAQEDAQAAQLYEAPDPAVVAPASALVAEVSAPAPEPVTAATNAVSETTPTSPMLVEAIPASSNLGTAPEQREQPASSADLPAAAPPSGTSGHDPAPVGLDASHWSTGEVAIQTHRPSSKKRKNSSQPEPEPAAESPAREAAHPAPEERTPPAEVLQEAPAPMPEPAGQEEWIRTGESIRFIETPPSPMAEPTPHVSFEPERRVPETLSPAAAAVDVLFESSGRFTKTAPREPLSEPRPRPRLRAKLSRIRIAATIFVGSCFSTTRAIAMSFTVLVVFSCALAALVVGGLGLTWMMMEQAPSPAFHSLTTPPQRTLSDPKKNGYLLLLGFDAPPGLDPLQAGYERKPDGEEAARAAACSGDPNRGSRAAPANASASVANGWFQAGDPASRFKAHEETIKGWLAQAESALTRYKQWVKMPFEDWGYGQSVSPPCGSILFAHRLYLADGFLQSSDAGLDRLESDMEAWRIALGQAKTLSVKTMALQAIHDDAAVASGLLTRPDFDQKYLGRLTRMLRPLDQVELSIRWPMQSQLVWAAKTFETQLKAERGEDPPLYAAVAAALPLPKQRRFNDYAAYYEASYKAAGEGRYGSMPKWRHYLRYPADSLLDYLANPIENIIGLEPLAEWDRYNGLVVDADARLRLASLQAWLRRGPQDADLLARIAKAGQSFYDPYTGLPMLVNLKKGVMYSVGHDGKDQDADPREDIVVAIPLAPSPSYGVKSLPSKVK